MAILAKKKRKSGVRIGHLMEQVRTLKAQLARVSAELDEARTRARYDELTGLHRRWVFQKHAEAILAGLNANPGADPLAEATCLLLLDVKKFKQINEGPGGMMEGDRAIRAVAEALRRVFTRIGDIYCRFGGDEFAALLRGVTKEKAQEIIREINAILSKLYPRLVLRGVCVFYRPGMSFEDMYREAGIAMARVKSAER